MKLPIHRWYRYTAGFSADWVSAEIEKAKRNGPVRLLDPFAGSGTAPLQAIFSGAEAYGIESNPFVCKIANAKLCWRKIGRQRLIKACRDVLFRARGMKRIEIQHPDLIERCYPSETLAKLDALKLACNEMDVGDVQSFVWFVITSILRSVSPVGTAQWQYIQPRKTKARVLDPYEAFERKLNEISADIIWGETHAASHSEATVVLDDARNPHGVPSGWANLVVTSPPYANNYDYADAMRLEMLFWDEIAGWRDLQSKVSVNLIRACTQHVSGIKDSVDEIVESEELLPIRDALKRKFDDLASIRNEHGGKKNYHLMIAAYFYDLARVFKALNAMTSSVCKMCFVIGDSAPYGIYIPVDEWLGELSLSAGFSRYRFEKLRDRNVKWKNRKHTVPLKEGRLWIDK